MTLGYDVALVAPVVALTISLIGPPALFLLGVAFPVASGVSAAIAVSILAIAGPTKQTWQLTAPTRLTSVFTQTQQQSARTPTR